jgi:hypothetical protein
MSRSILFLIGIAGSIAAAVAACSAGGGIVGGGGAEPTGSTGKSGVSSTGSSSGTDTIAVGSASSGSGASACDSRPDEDKDHDGFAAKDECNDCDPFVNPDAVDTPLTVDEDGGIVDPADNNCDEKKLPDVTCDDGLPLAGADPKDAAKAMDICQTTVTGKSWGLIDAKYVSADGKNTRVPGLQVGLLNKFGPNVLPLKSDTTGNKAMFGLSSGHMRAEGQQGFCVVDPTTDPTPSQNCQNPASNGPPPKGFPQNVPGCTPSTVIHDDVALELRLRAPSNATGYKFNFRFYSFEYPEWVCDAFNDQFVALVTPAPVGAINGNISFDIAKNPVSVNIAFFDVCDPGTKNLFADHCKCKTAPDPYCPKGLSELEGTGMIINGVQDGGGTSWLETTAPIKAREEFTIRFAIWDTGDHNLDSHVLIDSFRWIATPGVQVGTKPPS